MKLSDFDFDLPEDLIALRPVKPRRASKLLVVRPDGREDRVFSDIADILQPGDRLVLNDTKVIPARIFGTRARDTAQGPVTAKVDVTLLAPLGGTHWRAMLKPMRKVALGEVVTFSDSFRATCVEKNDRDVVLDLHTDAEDIDAALQAFGQMPLPPYIAAKRPADGQDAQDYQTVWAKTTGAVAAPTASLHFDEAVMDALDRRGVGLSFVTLHVGAGTFLPVKVEDVTTHKMHAEWGQVPPQAAQEIAQTKAQGGRVIAVGTTALRLIETAAQSGTLKPWEGETDIFIYPGFDFQITDGLVTNFHLPKSTLLMLVSALMGKATMDAAYRHAIAQKYRFFSYGDASLLLP